MKLDLLINSINKCCECEAHLPNKPKPIFQLGVSSKIVIVGQAPGEKAHISGKAFDDASGMRLRAWLGVTEEQFYDPDNFALLPMGFCYPGKAKSGDMPPRTECAKLWRKELEAHLQHCKLTILIGQYAQRYYLGEQYENVAKNVQYHSSHYFCLPHPSPRNIAWFKSNPWFESSTLEKLRQRVSNCLQLVD